MIARMNHVTHSPEETQELAASLAEQFVKKYAGAPLVIALEGDLGAGKTTFTQSFAKALGVAKHLKSPTFVLMKHYALHDVPGYSTLYHLDCYRLQDPKDLEPLGVEHILKQPGNIILIEWAERVKEIMPAQHIQIQIEHSTEQERNITIND